MNRKDGAMSAGRPEIVIGERDYQGLLRLIEDNPSAMADALEEELERANIVPTAPADAVSMNARATFQDLDSGWETTVNLVYPEQADVSAMKISVLSPVGSALIGLPVGGAIDWPLGNGRTRRLKVVGVEK